MIRAFTVCVIVPILIMYTVVQLWVICSDVNNIKCIMAAIAEEILPPEPAEPVEVTPRMVVEEQPPVDESAREVIAQVDDLLTPSGLTAEELELGLLGDLKPYAACFIQAEANTGVNAIFLSSVAALESGWCTSRAATDFNNLFGWNIYEADMIGLNICSFDSKEECIDHVAQRLKNMYLSPLGIYFEGYSVDAVNTHYNGSEEWAEEVKLIMDNIAERINTSINEE